MKLPPEQQGLAKLARWHHAQIFCDLRKFRMDEGVVQSSTLEVRAHLRRVSEMPKDVNQDMLEFPVAPYEAAGTYLKFRISFSRLPLPRLCPRDIKVSASLFVPDPPKKPPRPTAAQEFEETIRVATGKLTRCFAQACVERG